MLHEQRRQTHEQASSVSREVLQPLQAACVPRHGQNGGNAVVMNAYRNSDLTSRHPHCPLQQNQRGPEQQQRHEWWGRQTGSDTKRVKTSCEVASSSLAKKDSVFDVMMTLLPPCDKQREGECMNGSTNASTQRSVYVLAVVRKSSMNYSEIFGTYGVWNSSKKGWVIPFSRYDEVMKVISKNPQQDLLVDPLHTVAKLVMKQVGLSKDDTMRYGYIPSHIENKLMSFQREGVKFVLRNGGRALLGDEMGLGKTVQALAVLSAYRDEWPVLIVCPSSLRESWSIAIQEWLGVPENKIRVVHSGKDADQTRLGSFDFLVISYNFLDKMDLEQKFNMTIVDESHYLKDPSAKRTRAAMPILKQSKRCLLLTGTPALNRPKEIFTQLSCLVPKANLKMKDFGERYCSGNRFDKYGGAKNLEELFSLLRNSIMIRRLKADVLAELPHKRRQQIFLSLDNSSKKKLDALQQQMQESRAAISHMVAQSVASKKSHIQVSAEQKSVIMEVYKKTADLKVKCVQDYVDTLLNGGEKFLIFAHHTSLLDAIEHSCNRKKDCKYIRIDGSTPPLSRAKLVESFQNDTSIRVAILSIRAAGVGLTLTAASTVVFAEMTWTPGEIIQAEDRAHRIGQAASVNVYFLHIKNSIDDVIWNSIQSKLENLGQTLDGMDQNLKVSQSKTLPEKGQTQILSFLSQSQKDISGDLFTPRTD